MLDERQITKRFLAPYLRNTDVQWDGINVDDLPEMDFDESEQKLYGLRPGDILMCEGGEIGRCAIWDSDRRCFYQKALHRLRPTTDKDDPRYFVLVMRAAVEAGLFSSRASAATIQHLPAEKLRVVRYPAPPIEEQRAIVDRVSRQTARLDTLVAAKQRLIDLLAEKRKAIIAAAVTRGLDPQARMAPTGVEWMPEAPSHWRPSRIGRLFRQSKVLGFPDLTVLSVYREYGVIERSSRDDNANVLPDDLTKYQLVEAGDLVVNKMKAWQGSLGISDLRGITSPDYVVFRPTHSELPAYLHFMLRTPQLTTVYLSNSNGIRINQWRIEPERFLNVSVLLPPMVEQRAIVEHIARETAKLDAVRAATERTIALLKERRSALIAAAVTGQLDLTTGEGAAA
jgi:type I restriction enzyme S subunit